MATTSAAIANPITACRSIPVECSQALLPPVPCMDRSLGGGSIVVAGQTAAGSAACGAPSARRVPSARQLTRCVLRTRQTPRFALSTSPNTFNIKSSSYLPRAGANWSPGYGALYYGRWSTHCSIAERHSSAERFRPLCPRLQCSRALFACIFSRARRGLSTGRAPSPFDVSPKVLLAAAMSWHQAISDYVRFINRANPYSFTGRDQSLA